MSERLDKKLEKASKAYGAGRRLEAERLFRSILAEAPDHPATLTHLALIEAAESQRKGSRREAALALGRALALDPSLRFERGFSSVLSDLSVIHRHAGELGAAHEAARRAVDCDPESARGHAVLSAVLTDAWRIADAVTSAERAVALDPSLADAHFRLGAAIFGRGDVRKALASFRKALELEPSHALAHSNLIFGMAYLSEYDAGAVAAEARAWARRHAEPRVSEAKPHPNERDPERRLRVGYVSADFRWHPSAHFTLPLVEGHDRSAVEVFCYSSGRPDALTERFRKRADAFRDVGRESDESLAELVRADGIDVLVDLSLHSGGHRLLAFARRPAPVQIAYLGYLGTTGLAQMDYRLAASDLDDPEVDRGERAVEAPLELPDTYWCYDPLDEGSGTEPASTAANGALPLTLGSLNSFHKQSDETLELWARVLRAVPESRFIVHQQPEGSGRVLETLERAGVERARVTTVPRRSRPAYLATLRAIDLCLDTVPYAGATTTLDALWVGTPTLTLVGGTPVGRAGLHICRNVGLPELVARSPEEFVDRARELTADRERLATLRASLRPRLLASPLMDAPRFVRNLEAAYRRAFRAWCEGRDNRE